MTLAHSGVSRPSRRGFTLVELLVVISVIALLISILLPSLNKAREQAKEVTCMANLQGLGRGFAAYATGNDDYFCSGSVDPDIDRDRDGPINQVGWIADLVNGDYARPAEALCPSNQAKSNQKIGLGSDSAGGPNGYYTQTEVREFIKRGYNSNYTQSWYMARTEMLRGDQYGDNTKSLENTKGPLRLTYMLKVSPSRVPLLGDGSVESADRSQFPVNGSSKVVRTMTDGPKVPRFGPQDFSDFGPAHGIGEDVPNSEAGKRYKACVLFADGHVGRFIDKVRDGRFAVEWDRDLGEYVQQDVDAQVFDGIISLGRRSKDKLWGGYQ